MAKPRKNVRVQIGQPDTRPPVETDANWLRERIARLEEKVPDYDSRKKNALKEITLRKKQLAALEAH